MLALNILDVAHAADLSVVDLPSPPAYDYPVTNRYAATVITVPPEMKVDYSDSPAPDERHLVLYPDRKIPEGYWYERHGMLYSVLLQKKPAPLVYIVAGTGADVRVEKMRYLSAILYHAGFSVVLLPSPTHPDFIINASANFIAGNPVNDASDLYNVMKIIDRKVAEETQITGRMLTGYSLGALDVAFTAYLDDQQHALNFSRVLLINPPYNLYSSLNRIDAMLYSALPQGINNVDTFLKGVLIRLSSVNQTGDPLDFSNERLLIDAYEKYKPDDARLATTIGLSFRLWAASMIFTSDVMSHSGYIFPKNQEYTTSTHLNEYMAIALRTSFKNYFDDVYTNYYSQGTGLNKQQLIDQAGLQVLAGYIYNSRKFGLITNQDDVILAPGELQALSAMFGTKAIIFDIGGHLGNATHPTVAWYIANFMRGGW